MINLVLTLLLSSAHAGSLTAKEIMIKNEEARRVSDLSASATLITGLEGSMKTKTFSFWRKIQSDHVHNNTLTRFHSPAEVKNEGILIVENASGRNDVLLYLPSYKKIRRVESQQQSGSFMGSVFSYSDIATPHVEDFQYKMIREEPCPSAEAQKVKCSVIESTPANDDVKERTGYTKVVSWLRMDNFMAVQGEYYNLESTMVKRLEASELKEIDREHHFWFYLMKITNLKTNEHTTLQFTDVKGNSGISDSIFTQQNLQKVN